MFLFNSFNLIIHYSYLIEIIEYVSYRGFPETNPRRKKISLFFRETMDLLQI